MRGRESPTQAVARWAKLAIVQEEYEEFTPFLQDGMIALGFSATEIQIEIGDFMAHGPQNQMVQAQRGQAKTTVAALFAVWTLIQNPAARVLIISAGETQADEIATLIVRLVMNLDVLECLRPDKMAGDRTATDAFDVHHSLKGLDKSPSIACVGINANLQGKRADLLIADDVESEKNSRTAGMRAQILHITKDFTSIADRPDSRILWLGTPQSIDSIYNTLPGRGITVRIWPGRYPTPLQRASYGTALAPSIAAALEANPSLGHGGGMLGDQGQPLDLVIRGETVLQKKELDQTTAYFQLQYMLSTAMNDALRFPLKPSNLIVLRGSGGVWPLSVTRSYDVTALGEYQVQGFGFKLMRPHEVSKETGRFNRLWAYIDPAAGGANADETAYAVGGFLNGNITLVRVGGILGGYELEKLQALADILCEYRLDGVRIEKNMGHGAFRAVFQPILRAAMEKRWPGHTCQIDDDLVPPLQKELRIINVLSPIMGRGSLIVDEALIEQDELSTMRYAASQRQTYSFFFQLAKLTAVRDSLIHDDRIDAVAGLCGIFTEDFAKDQKKAVAKAQEAAHRELTKDPLGYNRTNRHGPSARPQSMLRRRYR